MIARTVFRVGVAACFAGAVPLAMAQDAGKPEARPGATLNAAAATGATAVPAQNNAGEAVKPAAAVALDAAPNAAAPDPLTPPEPNGPPPKAPGAEQAKPAETAQAPVPEPDPIAAQILADAAKAGGKSDHREDVNGAKAFYTENKGQPIWVTKEGFNPRALKAEHEILNANDWGLDASAFQLPAAPSATATPEALAEAEIKLSLAVLKYARYAEADQLDRPRSATSSTGAPTSLSLNPCSKAYPPRNPRTPICADCIRSTSSSGGSARRFSPSAKVRAAVLPHAYRRVPILGPATTTARSRLFASVWG